MKALFQRLITDFQETKPKSVVERDYKIPLDSPKIVSLIGVRRCGKTHLCYGLINELRKTVDPHNVVYPDKRDEQVYLFLDEVQNIPNWERYIRRIHDTLNVRVFVTGSSSRLLSKEIATSLRGRTLTHLARLFGFNYLS
ncbi:ATP-binding protein [Leucothrix arctica]|uniref:ATP-binding protein n=1 Tax=Leucothrix arctica TaxID=1481894 RepID=UPI001BA47C07|nr:AAA family ATPase [Leucothrix arctica]